jgi:hypothetical protein
MGDRAPVLRLILELFARDLRAEMRVRAQRLVAGLVWGVVAGLLALIGLVFLLVAAVIGLTPEIGAAAAWAVVGGAVLLFAGFAVLAAQPRAPRRPAPPAFAAPPVVPSAAADPSAMKQEGASGKTAMAVAAAALLAGLVLGRRL